VASQCVYTILCIYIWPQLFLVGLYNIWCLFSVVVVGEILGSGWPAPIPHTTSSVGPTSVSTLSACRKQHVLTFFFALFPRPTEHFSSLRRRRRVREWCCSPTDAAARVQLTRTNGISCHCMPPPLAKQINTAEPTPSPPPPLMHNTCANKTCARVHYNASLCKYKIYIYCYYIHPRTRRPCGGVNASGEKSYAIMRY